MSTRATADTGVRIQHFFDEPTGSLSYVVHDGRSGIVIDPVRDYEPKSGHTSWISCERISAWLEREEIELRYAIDTHADHLSGLPFFKERHGARSVTGARVGEIQRTFREIYHLGDDFPVDGRPFDVLLDEGKRLGFGSLEVEALHTPGHTTAHMSTTRLFVGHDYQPGGRPLAWQTTVAEQKRRNVQIHGGTTRQEYVAFREQRDAVLEAPTLILPAIQVNIRAGELPPPEANGIAYLKIPLDVLGRPG